MCLFHHGQELTLHFILQIGWVSPMMTVIEGGFNMYKLILVDDEADIRQGLKEVIPFETLGFQVVGEAANGLDALALCEKESPDLMITDIRMPLMDGLTLCHQAREMLPALHFVIISGYDDFSYAQQAISEKAMGYLLKPINASEFIEMLQGIKMSMDEEMRSRMDVEMLRRHYRETLPILREGLLTELLSSAMEDEEALSRGHRAGMDLTGGGYVVALFRVGQNGAHEGMDTALQYLAVAAMLQDEMKNRNVRGETVNFQGQLGLLLILPDAKPDTLDRVLAHLEEARRMARHYLNAPLYGGIGAVVPGLSMVSTSAAQAVTALHHAMILQEEPLLRITDIHALGTLTMDDAALSRFMSGLRAKDEDRTKAVLHTMIATAAGARPTPQAWRIYCMEILTACMRIAAEQSLEDMGQRLDAMTRHLTDTLPYPEEMERQFSTLVEDLLSAMESSRLSMGKLISSQAEEYLRGNYHQEDLSLEQLCMHLHISASYFSLIFKRETRKTFHQYLTELRMDKALELLNRGDIKVSEIARQVGLPDPSYFSYCFKKHFGYAPSKIRNGKGGAP